MPFRIYRRNITTVKAEAIVADEDGKIENGKYGVILIERPQLSGNLKTDEPLLEQYYTKALTEADAMEFRSVAVPLITLEPKGQVKNESYRIATSTVRKYLESHDDHDDYELLVYLVISDKKDFFISNEKTEKIQKHVSNNYDSTAQEEVPENKVKKISARDIRLLEQRVMFDNRPTNQDDGSILCSALAGQYSQAEILAKYLKETLGGKLREFIDKHGLTDSYVYHKANMYKQTFNKMLNKINYNAGREKIFAVALAMELSIEEVNELLKVAGIQFKPNDKFEVAINFCFDKGYYDIDDIAEFLEETKWGKLWKD